MASSPVPPLMVSLPAAAADDVVAAAAVDGVVAVGADDRVVAVGAVEEGRAVLAGRVQPGVAGRPAVAEPADGVGRAAVEEGEADDEAGRRGGEGQTARLLTQRIDVHWKCASCECCAVHDPPAPQPTVGLPASPGSRMAVAPAPSITPAPVIRTSVPLNRAAPLQAQPASRAHAIPDLRTESSPFPQLPAAFALWGERKATSSRQIDASVGSFTIEQKETVIPGAFGNPGITA